MLPTSQKFESIKFLILQCFACLKLTTNNKSGWLQ